MENIGNHNNAHTRNSVQERKKQKTAKRVHMLWLNPTQVSIFTVSKLPQQIQHPTTTIRR
jgi:hypothetical protein